MSWDEEQLRNAANAFLKAAWHVLETQHVVPTPVFHPHLEVGRDYFGPDLAGLPEYVGLEKAIEGSHPRFREPVASTPRDFAGPYIFSFLEAFVARSTGRAPPSATSAVSKSVRDLVTAVQEPASRVACCRIVSHLTTVDGDALDLPDAGVRVVPLKDQPAGHGVSFQEVIGSVIPGAASAYGRVTPFVYSPPESVLVTQATGDVPSDLAKELSGQIEGFLLAARLLHAGTSESLFEVRAECSRVRRLKPTMVRFRGAGGSLLSFNEHGPENDACQVRRRSPNPWTPSPHGIGRS